MRPPWDHGAQGAGDLQALETDVMRFIAILGLCLAAIFSLVNGAAEEPRDEAPAPVERQSSTRATAPVNVPAPAPPQKRLEKTAALRNTAGAPADTAPPRPETSPAQPTDDAEEPVFTLEFESGGVLERLLASGQIQLYAGVDGRFRVYRSGRGFQPTEAPVSYFRMQAETVPRRLRSQIPVAVVSEPVQWGVTLPESTLRELRKLMSGREGGNLLIGSDAGVSFERASSASARR